MTTNAKQTEAASGSVGRAPGRIVRRRGFDGRTSKAKRLEAATTELVARAGIAADDAPRLALARRAAGVAMMSAEIEARMLRGLPIGEKRFDAYVRAAGTLSRLYRQLGVDKPPAPPRQPTIHELLARDAAAEAAE